MNMHASSTLEIDFRHPGEAAIVLRAIIAAYTEIRPTAEASGIPEVSEHIAHRLADLEDCLAEAEFDLSLDEAFPAGHA